MAKKDYLFEYIRSQKKCIIEFFKYKGIYEKKRSQAGHQNQESRAKP